MPSSQDLLCSIRQQRIRLFRSDYRRPWYVGSKTTMRDVGACYSDPCNISRTDTLFSEDCIRGFGSVIYWYPFEPLFGTAGQGIGASPVVWLTLAVLLLNKIEKVVPERIWWFQLHDGTLEHRRLVDAFADASALGFTDNGALLYNELFTCTCRTDVGATP